MWYFVDCFKIEHCSRVGLWSCVCFCCMITKSFCLFLYTTFSALPPFWMSRLSLHILTANFLGDGCHLYPRLYFSFHVLWIWVGKGGIWDHTGFVPWFAALISTANQGRQPVWFDTCLLMKLLFCMMSPISYLATSPSLFFYMLVAFFSCFNCMNCHYWNSGSVCFKFTCVVGCLRTVLGPDLIDRNCPAFFGAGVLIVCVS